MHARFAAMVQQVQRSSEQFMQTNIYHNGTIHLMVEGPEDPGGFSCAGGSRDRRG